LYTIVKETDCIHDLGSVMTSCSRSICTHFPFFSGLGLAYASNQLHSHILLHIKTFLTNVQQGGVFIHTNTNTCSARVQHEYNDIRLHNTKLHNN